MKAIVWTAYGPPEVLQLKEVEKPNPKDNEVQIKIYATTVTAGDSELRSLKFPLYLSLPMRIWVGLSKPSRKPIPGTELAGKIASVGKDVTLFSEGDRVFGSSGLNFGANAEYICLPEGALTVKPANMTFEEAAAVPFGGRDALHFLREGNVSSGQKVLINGAGGSIGTFAVQLTKHFGAEVSAVDSTDKLEMLRSIGADQVIDYTEEDFTKNGEIYDVIFDVIGKVSLSASKNSLRENGTYLLANPGIPQLLGGLWTRITSSTKVVMQAADPTTDDLVFLRELIEAGKIETVIDREYSLEQTPDAHRNVDTGQKHGMPHPQYIERIPITGPRIYFRSAVGFMQVFVATHLSRASNRH